MNFFADINYWAVVVSTIVYYFIGFIWYTLLFGRTWRKETGVSNEIPVKPPIWAMVGQFIATFIYTLGFAIILQLYGASGITAGICVSLLVTAFFVIPINSGNLFFTGKKKLFLLDVCERAIGSIIIGIILSIWR